LYLVTNLADAKILSGLDRPLPQGPGTVHSAAVATGKDALEDVLAHAMQHGYTMAAIGATEVLADIGDDALLRSDDGHPRPLAMAMRHGDRRLRLAAAEAVMKINPQQCYPGSSYLPETFGYLIRTVGSRRVLVAHPRVEKAQTLVGMLNQIGFEADAARSGREAFRLAARNPDYECVLISDAVDFPAASETVQMMRKDPLTSRLPIGLMAREPNLKKAQDEAARDPRTLAFPRPHNERGMAFQLSRLLALAGHELVPYDERLDQAQRALDHLIRLAETPQQSSFYDLYRQKDAVNSALFTPPLSAAAARLMGLLGSPDAQRSLVTLASQHARPLAEREAAAKGFAMAVDRHGLLLSRGEILQQYERYNHSELMDSGTQQVLGSILDTIEQPSQQAGSDTEASQIDNETDNTTDRQSTR
jgi:CheY-like chemotaxis protein